MTSLDDIRRNVAGWFLKPVLPLLTRSRISPNLLTLFGLIINGLAAYLVILHEFIWAGLLILFSGLFDMFDGAVARSLEKVSHFGAVFDSTADRLAEALVLFGILLVSYESHRQFEIILVFATLVGSFLTSYIRARAEGLGIECKVGWFTRAERVVLLSLGLILNQVLVTLAILTVLTFFTVGQRLVYVSRHDKPATR